MKWDFTNARPLVHTHSLGMTSTGYLTSLFPSDLLDSLFPNYASPLVPINTCRRLSFLIGSLPGLLSVSGGGGEVSHKDASETHLKNKSSKVHYFHRSDPPLPQHKHPRCPPSPPTDNSALEVRGEGSLWASTTPPQPRRFGWPKNIRLIPFPRPPLRSSQGFLSAASCAPGPGVSATHPAARPGPGPRQL